MSVVRYTKADKEIVNQLKKLLQRHKASSAFEAFVQRFGKETVVSSSGAASASSASSTSKKK